MLQSLPIPPSNLLPPLSSDDGLGVAAAAFAASLPRAVANAHVASEINSSVRPLGLGWGGREIVGNMLMAFELEQLSAVDDVQPPGFPDAVVSLEVKLYVSVTCIFIQLVCAGCDELPQTEAIHGAI
jgi:hypothetical protein